MKTSTAVALGMGALVLAAGGTAAVVYLRRRAEPTKASLPVTQGASRITVPAPAAPAPAPVTPAPGPAVAPQMTDAQRTAADVKAYADATRSVVGVVGDVATQLKGFWG